MEHPGILPFTFFIPVEISGSSSPSAWKSSATLSGKKKRISMCFLGSFPGEFYRAPPLRMLSLLDLV